MKTKACPNCGKSTFANSKNCIHCGYSFSNSSNNFLEIEEKARQLFESVDWQVKMSEPVLLDNKHLMPDITLYYNNELFGFVELYKGASPEMLAKKLNAIREYFTVLKPKIMVVTNLFSYYVSFFGEPFQKMMYVPTPFEGELVVSTVEEYFNTKPNNGGGNDGR